MHEYTFKKSCGYFYSDYNFFLVKLIFYFFKSFLNVLSVLNLTIIKKLTLFFLNMSHFKYILNI